MAFPSLNVYDFLFPAPTYPFAKHCSESYLDARKKFLNAVNANSQATLLKSIPVTSTEFPNQLYIDIALMGSLQASKFLIHISGADGVAGLPASAIQTSLLINPPIELKKDIAIIFIHSLNPYGEHKKRLVTETNVFIDRNFSDGEIKNPLYANIDHLINPEEPSWLDHFLVKLSFYHIRPHGWQNLINAIASGQKWNYEGIFYGGIQPEEGPKAVIDWFESELLTNLQGDVRQLQFAFIDVEVGRGEYGEETLILLETPQNNLFKNRKVSVSTTDSFVKALSEKIQQINGCVTKPFLIIKEHFASVSNYKFLMAVRDENSMYHFTKRNDIVLNPQSYETQMLLNAFYPQDREWRDNAIKQGRSLCSDTLLALSQMKV